MRTRIDMPANNEIRKFVVRLPEQLRNDISTAAKQSHRSMNSEIISRLGSSFRYNPLLSETEPSSIQATRTSHTKMNCYNLDTQLFERIKSLSDIKKSALLEILDNEEESNIHHVG